MAGGEGAYVLDRHIDKPAKSVLSVIGDMRRYEDIGGARQHMMGKQLLERIGPHIPSTKDFGFVADERLLRKNVKARCPYPAAGDRPHQRIGFNDITARRVDQDGALLHQCEFGIADHPLRAGCRGQVERDDIGFAEKGGEVDIAKIQGLCDLLARRDIIGDHIHSETAGDPDNALADPARADHAYRLAEQIEPAQIGLIEVAVPSPIAIGRQMARQAQQQCKHMFGDGHIAIARHIRDSDTRLGAKVQIDVIIAGRSRRDQPEMGHLGQNRYRQSRMHEDRYDFDVVIGGDIGFVERALGAGELDL